MQDFFFRQVDDRTYALMGYKGDEARVVIPPTHWGGPVTILFDDVFEGHGEITHVVIPETVTDLGEFLFSRCTGLRGIQLPDSLRFIWPYAFAYSGIEEIVLPHGLASISPFVFKDCKSLRRVVCGAGMRKIYDTSFLGCVHLEELVCPEDTQLSSKALPDGVRLIRR